MKSILTLACMAASFAVVAADSAKLKDWKTRVPRPIYDEKPELVELYDRTWEIAHARIDNLPGIPAPRYVDEGHRSDRIWIWDTCFMVHFCKYCPEEFPGIESLENFYAILLADATNFLPKVRGNGHCGADEGRMLDFRVHHPDNPPLFAWTEYVYALQTGDRARLEKVYLEKRWLQRWYELFENFDPAAPQPFGSVQKVMAKRTPNGYHWGGCPSGMDNTPRGRTGEKDARPNSPRNCPDNPGLLWVDACSQQALAALSISRIAELLGDTEGASEWRAKYVAKKTKVNELYWDEEDGFYYDILAGDCSKCKVPTIASYWPLIAEVPSPRQQERLIEKLTDPQWFGGDIPTPSLARKDADFCPAGGYWRGGVWMPTTYMAIKGLDRFGEFALARNLAKKIVFDMYETYRQFEPHTVWECYSPTEPKPATYGKKPGYSRPDFCGWSALGPISLFVEDILGIKEANAFTNTLVCDFPPTVKGRVGVENYRFGTVICSIIVERRDVRIVSNAPFELVANGERRTVMKGSQIFQLNDSLGGARYE